MAATSSHGRTSAIPRRRSRRRGPCAATASASPGRRAGRTTRSAGRWRVRPRSAPAGAARGFSSRSGSVVAVIVLLETLSHPAQGGEADRGSGRPVAPPSRSPTSRPHRAAAPNRSAVPARSAMASNTPGRQHHLDPAGLSTRASIPPSRRRSVRTASSRRPARQPVAAGGPCGRLRSAPGAGWHGSTATPPNRSRDPVFRVGWSTATPAARADRVVGPFAAAVEDRASRSNSSASDPTRRRDHRPTAEPVSVP